MAIDLRHRSALITGAGRGMGRAIALALAGAGARVTLAARTEQGIAEAAAEIRARGGSALHVTCDVADPAAIVALVSAAGSVDMLVNAAGVAPAVSAIHTDDAVWENAMQINLTAPFQLMRAVLPGMVERRWGRIINIASTAAKTGIRGAAAYTASKHGLLGLTRAVALEVATKGITVNAICPGYANTPMTSANVKALSERNGKAPEETAGLLTRTSPQQRLIEPEEVAFIALMLCGDEARGITGQGLNVDGGAVLS